MSLHTIAVTTFLNMLHTLRDLLDKGAEHARAKGQDPDALIQARLAPDMAPLATQVQIATDHAVMAMGEISGRGDLRAAMTEKTLDELKARIAATIAFVESVPESAFAGAEARAIVIPIPPAKIALHMTGEQMLRDWSLPNFYFHVVTAYDILRHEGVQIGKRDFIPFVTPYIRPMAEQIS